MNLRRRLRFRRPEPPTSSFRVAVWSKGITPGFVVEMKVEDSWLPMGKVFYAEDEAEAYKAELVKTVRPFFL